MKASDIRKSRKMTQAELADAIGVEQPTISRFERGLDGITLKVIKDIANALGVSVSDLFAEDRTDSEQALLDIYRNLPPERQKGWLDLARTISAEK